MVSEPGVMAGPRCRPGSRCQASRWDSCEGPPADCIVTRGELVCDVRVETLHAHAGAADTARRPRPDVVGSDFGITFEFVASMDRRDLVGIEFGFDFVDRAARFDSAHRLDQFHADEIVERRHRRAIVEEGCIADHDGIAGRVANDDLEVARGAPGRAARRLAPDRPSAPAAEEEQDDQQRDDRRSSSLEDRAAADIHEVDRLGGRSVDLADLRLGGLGSERCRSDAGGGPLASRRCRRPLDPAHRRWRPSPTPSSSIIVFRLIGELIDQLGADVAENAAAELCDLAGDVQVGRDDDLRARGGEALGVGLDVGRRVAAAAGVAALALELGGVVLVVFLDEVGVALELGRDRRRA